MWRGKRRRSDARYAERIGENPLRLRCLSCRHIAEFAQPYPYHAGFADQGFLYDESGTATLVWSLYDPAYERLAGPTNGSAVSMETRRHIESCLVQSPKGTAWGFDYPARCPRCASVLSAPMHGTVHYLVYPGSVITDLGAREMSFASVLKESPGSLH